MEDLSPGDVYLFEADNPLVLAYGVLKNGITWKTRLLVTSADVLHCFRVPRMAVKIDACPGRITEVAVVPRKIGIYVGICSELCGRLHRAIPINVEVLNCKDYIRFVKAGVALNS